MSTTMAVEDIKLTLPELLDSLAPGDEVTRTTVPGTFPVWTKRSSGESWTHFTHRKGDERSPDVQHYGQSMAR